MEWTQGYHSKTWVWYDRRNYHVFREFGRYQMNTPVRKVVKPFFIGFAILDMFKHIIYDFYYNVLKNTFDNTELSGKGTDSFILQLSDKGNIVHKMWEMHKSYNFSELDNTSSFYGQLVNLLRTGSWQEQVPFAIILLQPQQEVTGSHLQGWAQRTWHHRVVGLRPKMYCLDDRKNVVYTAAKGVPRNMVIDGERMSVKNIDLYKRVLEAESKKDVWSMALSSQSTIRDLLSARWNKPRPS